MNQILQRNERNHNHEKYKQKTGDGKMFKQKLQIETQEVMNMNMNSTSVHDTLNYCGYIQTIHIHVDSANQMRIQTENRKKKSHPFFACIFLQWSILKHRSRPTACKADDFEIEK